MKRLLLILFLMPSAVLAQKFSIAPQIGFYIPTQNLLELTGIEGEPTTAELVAGPSFGARMGLWFGEHFGIDVSGNYVPTTFKLHDGNQISSEDAKLFNGAAQAVFFLLPRTSPISVYLNGGVGVVSRGGVAFTSAADKTDVGGVIGAGAGIHLGGLALTLGADLFAYTATVARGTTTESSFSQKDIQLKLGLGIPLGGK